MDNSLEDYVYTLIINFVKFEMNNVKCYTLSLTHYRNYII